MEKNASWVVTENILILYLGKALPIYDHDIYDQGLQNYERR